METRTFGERLKSTTRKVVKIIVVVAVLAGLGVFSFYYWGVYDEGVLAGNVLRISKKGVIFKTYEGKVNLQTFGALKGVNPIMESFDFSVESSNDEVIRDLEAVALSGERVNLHFVKRYAIFPWRGDTKYFITKVERLNQ